MSGSRFGRKKTTNHGLLAVASSDAFDGGPWDEALVLAIGTALGDVILEGSPDGGTNWFVLGTVNVAIAASEILRVDGVLPETLRVRTTGTAVVYTVLGKVPHG